MEEDTGQIPFWKLRVLFLFPGCPENSFTGRGRALCSADGVRGPGPLCTRSQALSLCPCTVLSAALLSCSELSRPCCCPKVFPFQFQSWLLTSSCSSANYNPRYNLDIQNIKISLCIKIDLFQNNCIAKSRNVPHPWFWRCTEFMHFCMYQKNLEILVYIIKKCATYVHGLSQTLQILTILYADNPEMKLLRLTVEIQLYAGAVCFEIQFWILFVMKITCCLKWSFSLVCVIAPSLCQLTLESIIMEDAKMC